MPDYNDNHLCSACGAKYGAHAGRGNPWCVDGTCPSGAFPKWPTTIDDDKRAGEVFDERVRKFWQASKSTFKPRS